MGLVCFVKNIIFVSFLEVLIYNKEERGFREEWILFVSYRQCFFFNWLLKMLFVLSFVSRRMLFPFDIAKIWQICRTEDWRFFQFLRRLFQSFKIPFLAGESVTFWMISSENECFTLPVFILPPYTPTNFFSTFYFVAAQNIQLSCLKSQLCISFTPFWMKRYRSCHYHTIYIKPGCSLFIFLCKPLFIGI